MGVDSAAVMAAGVIDTANLPYLQKEMKIDLKGKDVLGKPVSYTHLPARLPHDVSAGYPVFS